MCACVFLGKEVSKGSQLFSCSLVRFIFDMFKTAEHALIWDTVCVSYAPPKSLHRVLHKWPNSHLYFAAQYFKPPLLLHSKEGSGFESTICVAAPASSHSPKTCS